MGKKLKLSSQGPTLVARNVNEAMVAPMMVSGGVCIWRESGIKRSGLCFYVWQESVFSRSENVFTLNLVFFINFINFTIPMRFAKIMLQ
jgi:hypothetical protein